MRAIEKDLDHSILYGEIVKQCNDGGQIIGLEDLTLNNNTIDFQAIEKILTSEQGEINKSCNIFSMYT